MDQGEERSVSHILEVSPSQLRSSDTASNRADRVEEVLQLDVTTLYCPVEGAQLQVDLYNEVCIEGEEAGAWRED